MDMDDGTVWVRPDRPSAVVAGQVPHLDDCERVFCWCCGAEPVVAVVESTEDDGSHIRVGVCQQCLNEHAAEYIVVEDL